MRPVDLDAPAWHAGRRVRLGDTGLRPDDPGFFAGYGAFETLALRGGTALDRDAHLARLAGAARALELPHPGDDALLEAIEDLAQTAADPSWLRIVLSGGGAWWVYAGPLDPDPAGRPLTAVTLPWRMPVGGPLAGLKTLSYAAQHRGLAWAAARGADEGLWRNARGHWTEGCRSNLFVVGRGAVWTASETDGVLPGTVRAHALAVARADGFALHVGRLRGRRLREAREAFVTSSLGGVRPLIALDGRPVGDGRPGPRTLRWAAAVARRRAGTIPP